MLSIPESVRLSDTVVSWGAYCWLLVLQPLILPLQIVRERLLFPGSSEHGVQELRAENSALRARCAVASAGVYPEELSSSATLLQPEQEGIRAAILLRSFTHKGYVCLLSAGAQHGVRVNDIVVHEGMLLGRVTQVYPSFCRVLMVHDQCTKIAIVTEKHRVLGVYEGCNLLRAGRVSFISHLATVEVGEAVYTAENSLHFPAGYRIGYITKVALDQSTLYHVCLSVDLFALKTCQIVPNTKMIL
jgi:cell shape-determining protein MreC